MGNIFKCCGKTGKPVVRIIGLIDLLVAITVLLGGVVVCGAIFPGYLLPSSTSGNGKNQSTPNIVGIILLVVLFFLECCLFDILLSAVKNKNAALCDNWIKLRLILLFLIVFGLIYWMCVTKEILIVFIGGGIGLLYIFYRVYSLIVVRHYQNEVSPKDIKKLPLEIIPMQVLISRAY